MKGKGHILPLIVLYAAAFIAGFNENLMNMSLYSIMGEYGIDKVTVQWLVTGYMIMGTVGVISMAYFYRRFKLRLLFFVASALTIVGSALGLFAPNFPLLLLARVIAAAGAGLFIPMMMNSVLVWAPRNKIGQFMSIGGCMITFGPAFAPVVCGALVTAFGWHSVFMVPLVVMVVLLVIGAMVLTNIENTEAHLDYISVVLSAVFLFTLSFGLAEVMVDPVPGAVSLVLALASGAAFVVRQLKCAYPLIDMRPMRSIRFWPAVLMVFVIMTITFSLSVLLPLYFEGALGMSAFLAGIVILVPVLANTGMTLLGGRIMDQSGEWPLLPAGMLCMLMGVLGLAIAAPGLSAPAVFLAALFAFAGIGLVFSATQTAGLRTLSADQNPFGVALMTSFLQIAACIGPALFTGVMTATQDSATAAGAGLELATAYGFAMAMYVAACIVLVGLVTALVYALAARSRSRAKRAVEEGAQAVPAPAAPATAAPASTSAPSPVAAAAAGAAEASAPASAGIGSATIATVMERDAYAIPSTATVREAMADLIGRRVSGMPLVDAAGVPVGFVSDGDIMRYLADQHPLVTSAWSLIVAANSSTMDERLRQFMDMPVTELATGKVVTLGVNTSLRDASQLLAQHRYKKLPVVSQGKLVGVVNRSDVLRFAMESLLSSEPVA